ncbi:MAG: hypothetical protein IK085_10360 [Clostridia bacterium]|nr:hypothetical protein [Clostridia bacterium]
MTIIEAMEKYRLPNPSTPEDLEMRNLKVLTFGDRVLVAGFFYNGPGEPAYYGAVYEFLYDTTSCEDPVGIREVSEVEFEDDGHAIEWALKQK